jgi:hypothetical protein
LLAAGVAAATDVLSTTASHELAHTTSPERAEARRGSAPNLELSTRLEQREESEGVGAAAAEARTLRAPARGATSTALEVSVAMLPDGRDVPP